MHRYDLISCHDCGVLYRKRPLLPREKARCVRCRSVLYRAASGRGASAGLDKVVALTLGAALVFLIAQFFPIVELDVNGLTSSATLLGSIRVLWSEQMQVVATMVFLFTILFPAIELGSLLYVALGLRGGVKVPGFNRVLRAVQTAREWGMTEVLMIGILITVVKMTSLATVLPQPGLFAFGALTLLLAIVVSFDPKALWNLGDDLTRQALPGIRYKAFAPGAKMLPCHACGLVAPPLGHGKHLRCVRCGSALHVRKPNSISRTWALLIAAMILYIPANLLPVMVTQSLFGAQDDTIMSGVVLFWSSGSKGLAIIIFIASVVVPMLKLGVLALLAFTAQRRSRWRPRQRTVLYRMVEFIGRWSMLDIFVVTLTVALVRFKSLAVITAGPGALAFGAVVVLTMLAAMQFDPRLIWDPVDEQVPGEEEPVVVTAHTGNNTVIGEQHV
ncbi:PqiA/YebS family transporter subunit [Janthinobacterium sp. FT14W]|uniref:paraquat-inducible protein A n=1 Tax=Janthinobacterium sp. FT14W TaxID=2654253 RepID=UPI001264AA61|nr:paraquat-inducible protein A [Janthinobacterium sp. FT14W]KAB8060023.1 PqiA/YebS family transporter subunit [Janthinobacterium sp. FT14W]